MPMYRGGSSSLTAEQIANLAKVPTIEAALQKDGGELVAGESVSPGATRTYTVGDVIFNLENRTTGDRTVADPITVAELNKWIATGQYPSIGTTFPASKLIPAGYRLQHTDGSILINKTTRTTPAAIDTTKWSVESAGTASIRAWILNAGDNYAKDEELFPADDRRLEIADTNGDITAVRMTYRGAYTAACPELSATVLADWEYVSQSEVPSVYAAGKLAIAGFQFRDLNGGQVLQLKQSRVLPTTFDASQWEPVSIGLPEMSEADAIAGTDDTPSSITAEVLHAAIVANAANPTSLPELSEADAIAGTDTTASSITATVLNAAIADQVPGEMAEADALAGTDIDPLLISAATLQAKIDDAEPPELAEAVAIVGTDETPSLISAETLHNTITAHVSDNHELDDLFHAPKPVVADAGKVQTVSPTGTVIWEDVTPPPRVAQDGDVAAGTETETSTFSPDQLNTEIIELIEQEVRGVFLGSANKFNALPTSNPGRSVALNGDIAFLSEDDLGTNGTASAPDHPRGFYQYGGASFTLWLALPKSRAGVVVGISNTFAGLPTTDAIGMPIKTGDVGWLDRDDIGTGTASAPQYPRGGYIWQGGSFGNLFDSVGFTDSALPKPNGVATVGASRGVARADHTHRAPKLETAADKAARDVFKARTDNVVGDFVLQSDEDHLYRWEGSDYVRWDRSPKALYDVFIGRWIRNGRVYFAASGKGITALSALTFQRVESTDIATTVSVAAGAITFDTINIVTGATIGAGATELSGNYCLPGTGAPTAIPANNNVYQSLWFDPPSKKWRVVVGSRIGANPGALIHALPAHLNEVSAIAGMAGWVYVAAFMVRTGGTAGTLVDPLNGNANTLAEMATEFGGRAAGGAGSSSTLVERTLRAVRGAVAIAVNGNPTMMLEENRWQLVTFGIPAGRRLTTITPSVAANVIRVGDNLALVRITQDTELTVVDEAIPAAFDPNGLIAYASAANITTAMQSAHPTGQTFIQYVFAREGNAIDISIGGNVTGAMLKAEIPAANANVIQRISKRRAGAVDRLIADTELIGLGVYRIWRVGDLLICLVLESTELTDEIGALRQALGSIPAYFAGEVVEVDYERAMNIRGITTYMRCQIAHTCGATLDVAELNNWRYIGQHRTATAFPASTAVPEGWKFTSANQAYEARSNRLCGTTWNSWAEQSNWNGTSLTVFRDLQSNERINASEIRTTMLHGSMVVLMATLLVDYEAPFDLGDAESFNVIQQNQPYPAWAPNLPYPVGFKVMQGGQVRERIAAGTSGTTYNIAENTQWFTEDEPSQIIYHTGTPGNPDITTETAIALNTTTNAITHRWNPATSAWVTMATSSTSGTQINRSSTLFAALTDTVITIGALQVRYNQNTSGGNLEVRGATASGSLTYVATRNLASSVGNSGTSTLYNGPAGAYTTLGAGGLAINSYIRYVIITLDTFYEVVIANRADTNIHISATQYAQSPVVAALPAPAPTPVTATLTAGTFASTGTNTRQFQENGGSGTIVVPAGRVLDGLTATNGVTVQFTATGGFSAIVPANVLAFSLTPTFIPDVAAARTVALTVTSPETSAFPTNNINGVATYNFRVGDTVEVTLGPPHPLGRITSVTVPGGTVEILNARSGRVRIAGVTAAGVITVRAAWTSFLISGATVSPNRVEAFQPSTVQIEVPANNTLTGLTTTNGTVSGISANGLVTVTPDGNGDLVFTPTFTAIPAKATANHVANAGTALNCGSIRLRMNTAANRGLQIQSNTGANITWRSMSNWEGGGSPMNTGTATTNGWVQISDFNFNAISQFQNSIIWDETNNRKYLVFYTVQTSFNNSPMMITEL